MFCCCIIIYVLPSLFFFSWYISLSGTGRHNFLWILWSLLGGKREVRGGAQQYVKNISVEVVSSHFSAYGSERLAAKSLLLLVLLTSCRALPSQEPLSRC